MERKFNTLQFELFDAVAAGEEWALDPGFSSNPAVRILIDGRDLNAILVEAEARFEGLSPWRADSEYGHMSARVLLGGLRPRKGLRPGETHWADLSCCHACQYTDCWGVYALCEEKPQEVVWLQFTHTQVKRSIYPYDLEFHFEKAAYEAALDRLAELAREEERIRSEAGQESDEKWKELELCQPSRGEPDGSAAGQKFNTLQFESFDAAAAGEKWALREGWPKNPAVRILVDGRRLDAMIVEAEARFDGREPGNPDDEYGHMHAQGLLSYLRPEKSEKKPERSYLSLCFSAECLSPVQWGVTAVCLERPGEVVWFHFTHSQVKRSVYPYDFEFHFEKQAYKAAFKRLEEIVLEQEPVFIERNQEWERKQKEKRAQKEEPPAQCPALTSSAETAAGPSA